MNNFFVYFSRQSRLKLLAIGYLMVAVIFGLDYVTGVEFTFSIFYLIAVFFVAWFVGKAAGAVISLVSAAAWLLADVLVSPSHLHPIFSTWNTIGMFGFFLLFTYLLVAFKDAMEHEKMMAKKIQLGLLPKSIPQISGYEIATAWQPADTVAGDYFDVLALDEHALGLCIADVSGHGLPAALLMSNLQAGVKLLAAYDTAPFALCKKLNQLVCNNVAEGNFITFFYGLLDTATESLVYVNAGHNQPVLLHRDGRIFRLDKGGIPLGLEANRQYQQGEVKLDAGDRLVLFTDGLIECLNFKDEVFGQERLLALLSEHRQLDADGLKRLVTNAVAEFCQNIYLDDLTLVVMAMTR
jgi:serine phosphatase RsbU (regulator of sigma subunit)